MPRHHNIRPTLDFSNVEPVTKQSFKAETDVNNIIKRFDRDGVLSHIREGAPLYLDVSDMPDYRTALDTVNAIDDNFMELPAALRLQFDNDPAQWLDFVNSATREEIRDAVDAALSPVDRSVDPYAQPAAPEAPEAAPSASDGAS